MSDLLLGMLVDLDDPSVTPIADLLKEAEEQEKKREQIADSGPSRLRL